MHALSMGPHRGADWLGRSAIGGREANVAFERYGVRLWDPRHARAVWLCFWLGNEGQASCHVETFSPQQNENRSAHELWPLERTTLDPERAGVGIGECQLGSESTQGLVRGGDFSVAWRASFAGGSGPVSLLPRDSLYRPRRLSHKAALLAVGATVTAGELEIWHQLGREAHKSRISLAGWKVSAHHAWGTGPLGYWAAVDAFSLPEDGAMSAVAYPTRLLGLKSLKAAQGAWQAPAASRRFAAAGGLFGAQEPPVSGAPLVMALAAAGGQRAVATVTLPAGAHRQVYVGGERLVVAAQATLEWAPAGAGASAPVRAERVMVESSAPL